MEWLHYFHELVLELIQTRKQIKHQKLQSIVKANLQESISNFNECSFRIFGISGAENPKISSDHNC
jgi:predicted oxidoreductase (fatty acid repression mutant protein)